MSIARISRRGLLMGGLCTAAVAGLAGQRRVAAAPSATPRRVVLVFASGAWDPTYVLDPKPGIAGIDAPTGEIKELGGGLPVFTDPSRPNVEAFFAAHGSLATIINGINVASVAHPQSSHRILSGVTDDTAPDVAAIAAATHGVDLAAPYLVLGRTAFSGPFASLSARTGSANQLVTLLNPLATFPAVGQQGLPLVPKVTEEAIIRDHVLARVAAEQSKRPSKRLDDFVASLERSDAIREIGQIGDIEFSRSFDAQIGLAVEALDRGLCYSVQMETGNWDTHENNEQQGKLNDDFYAALMLLMDELIARPGSKQGSKLIDETMVVVVSEMGRTPRLNAAMGKDHWPVTSALVLGGGLKGGRVLGGSTDALDSAGIDLQSGEVDPNANPLTYASFAGGLLEAAGVDAGDYIVNAEPLHAIHA
ncbi:MAG: DUF1501 domain-containing protein [Myxococcales bacterium]|nr:DUF1501 domain-containing protein [Myxococcales bacterium]MCB9569856.1 DUF1501 domain-containing protein [Myxococcales bacterium]MCB9706452.1 DUF1501 domain-containing protein [Myxococcales bacterium]